MDRQNQPRIFFGHFRWRKKEIAHYKAKGNSISFSRMRFIPGYEKEGERAILTILVHELTHWAQYMFLSDEDINKMGIMYFILKNDSILEIHAREIAEEFYPMFTKEESK